MTNKNIFANPRQMSKNKVFPVLKIVTKIHSLKKPLNIYFQCGTNEIKRPRKTIEGQCMQLE